MAGKELERLLDVQNGFRSSQPVSENTYTNQENGKEGEKRKIDIPADKYEPPSLLNFK